MSNFKYFRGSAIVTIIGLIVAFFLGGSKGLFLTCILAILEISLSFDNTVINATVLKDMSDIWRKRFLTWGLLIAVFGMRIIFPIIIVSIVARISPVTAVHMALFDGQQYGEYMAQAHSSLMSFGGAFLLMVSLGFFLDGDRELHWLKPIEVPLQALGKIKFMAIIITVILFCVVGFVIVRHNALFQVVIPGILGLGVFILIEKISEYMESKEEAREEEAKKTNLTTAVAKNGLATFIYLEILDSSFSFDGVIGAFAITTDIFIIAIGLGVGALFVRSMTIMLVEKGTLSEYKYLEHGAFYAILSLAVIMFLQTFVEIPEVITGSIGACLIGASFFHSLASNKSEDKAESTEE